MTPINSMRVEASAVVRLAEAIDADERTVESGRLLVAARVFAGVVDCFIEYQRIETGETKR